MKFDPSHFLLLASDGNGAPSKPPLGDKRLGLVRADGRAVVDDTGSFYPLGLTFFWSMQGEKYEADHYHANLDWSAKKGFDFHRILAEVDWEGNREIDPQSPEWHDWRAILERVIDLAYDGYGIRTQVTLRGKGTAVDHIWLAREVGDIAAARQHKVISTEMENEYLVGGDPLDELVEMAREVKSRTPHLLGLSTPGDEATAEELDQALHEVGGQLYIRHLDRGTGDYKWRQVRQSYDFHNDPPFVGWSNEPAGPASSVATNDNPLQLAMTRAVGIMCGAPGYVLHTGTGVYGDGKSHPTAGPRPPNFWEIENIDDIVDAVRGIDKLIPAGVPNWTVANTQWKPPNPVAPFQPHNHWEGDHGDGVNKAYSALAPDGRVIQMPCGVRGHVRMTASYPLRDVVVYNPLTHQALPNLPTSFGQGESMDLPGGGQDAMVAYIIHGRKG